MSSGWARMQTNSKYATAEASKSVAGTACMVSVRAACATAGQLPRQQCKNIKGFTHQHGPWSCSPSPSPSTAAGQRRGRARGECGPRGCGAGRGDAGACAGTCADGRHVPTPLHGPFRHQQLWRRHGVGSGSSAGGSGRGRLHGWAMQRDGHGGVPAEGLPRAAQGALEVGLDHEAAHSDGLQKNMAARQQTAHKKVGQSRSKVGTNA